MDIDKLIANSERLSDPDEIARLMVEVLDSEQALIVSTMQEQISAGEKGDGKRTKEYVKDSTSSNPNYYVANLKKTPSKAMPHRNYFNEGDFQGDMFARGNNTSMFIGSFDDKSPRIEKEEGEEIFKPNEKNAQKIWSKSRPKFDKLLKNELLR